MSSEWFLEELGQVVTGKTPPKAIENAYSVTGVPFLTPKDMDRRKWISSTERYLSDDGLNAVKKSLVPEGSIAVSCIGSDMGKAVMIPVETVTNQQINTIIPDTEKCNPEYLYYLLSTMQQDFKDIAGGSATPILNKGHFGKVRVRLPDLSYQNNAARVLTALDDKIQLNTQTNQTLEQIAQAIFKSWFVDFDPVRAKMAVLEEGGTPEAVLLAAMRAISAKDNAALKQMQRETPEAYARLEQTAALFPSAMEQSELGEVPEGWLWTPFGELLEKTIGGDWGKEEPDSKHTQKVKILRGTDLPNVSMGNDSSVPTRYVEEKKLKTRKLQDSDIVIEVSGGSPKQPTGRSLYITDQILDRLDGVVEPASFCRMFRPKNKEIGLLLSIHLTYIYNEGKTWLYQNQSTGISNFQTKVFLEKEYVVFPCDEIVHQFFVSIRPIIDKVTQSESKSLAEIRDMLLPKLLSGEIHVSDVEKILE